ncbi:metal-dependent transcriptional regulator, partial [bacterium]|nr:metal-dependent transcriptional regulator [bacterium]
MTEKADHLLKTIWLMRERCIVDSDRIMSQVPLSVRATAKMLQRSGHVSIQNGAVELLPKGHQKAEVLIRRHLLAERLLSDVLLVGEKEVAKSACAFEHILSEEVTESVCTFLGHPPACPHGIAIPRGNCCSTFSTDVKPLVHRLTDLQIGDQGKITFITPGGNKTLDRLAIFGVVPGNTVKLEQRK